MEENVQDLCLGVCEGVCIKVKKSREGSERIHTGFGMVTSKRCGIEWKLTNKVGLFFFSFTKNLCSLNFHEYEFYNF